MSNQINPYAAPSAMEISPKAAEWLGTPNESLRRTATGFALARIGAVLILLDFVGGFVGGFAIAAARAMDAMQPLLLVLTAVGVIAAIVGLVGKVFCLSTPPETEAQGWIYASVGTEVLGLLITVAVLLGAVAATSRETAGYLQQLLTIVSSFAFVLFIRKLSAFIGRADLAQRATSLLSVGVVLVVLIVVWVGGAVVAVRNGAIGQGGAMTVVPVIAFWSAVATFLVALLKYISLLGDLKTAILTGR